MARWRARIALDFSVGFSSFDTAVSHSCVMTGKTVPQGCAALNADGFSTACPKSAPSKEPTIECWYGSEPNGTFLAGGSSSPELTSMAEGAFP
jgi:hypothetical protein